MQMFVYYYFIQKSDTNSWQPGALDVADDIMGLKSVKKIKPKDFEFTIINDSSVMFFVNIDDPANEGWQAVVNFLRTSTRATVPCITARI